MRIVTRELWAGHRATYILVHKWRRVYRLFNWVFASATRRREYLIMDQEYFMRVGC